MQNKLDFSGKTVLVVGGSSGLGDAIACHFRDHGAVVHIWGRRDNLAAYKTDSDNDFRGLHFSQVNVSSYIDWIYQQDWDDTYVYFRKALQFLQWQNGSRGKPMLLKGPSHTPHIGPLHKALPNAKFVPIQRNPVDSVSSLGTVVHMLYQLQPFPGTTTIPDAARTQEKAVRHCFLESLRTREAHPEIPVADIYFEEVCDDAINVAQRIFDFWGLPLSEQSRQAMTEWNLRNDKNRLGNFKYDPAAAKIDQARFEASIAPYMQQFYPKS